MPVRAFSSEGLLIAQAGYDTHSESVFKNQNIYDCIHLELQDNIDGSFQKTITLANRIHFSVCYICPISITKGIYILGPFTSHQTCVTPCVYKPLHCIPHLMKLMYGIASDSQFILQKDAKLAQIHNLHVKKALDYLETNYQEPITLTEICKHIGINKSYFCTVFKAEVNKSFSQYLNTLRIKKGRILLVETNHSILDIALMTGFNNANYFNMVFKKQFNQTPQVYRSSYFKNKSSRSSRSLLSPS
jgi:AraC-like DNA-binding protein